MVRDVPPFSHPRSEGQDRVNAREKTSQPGQWFVEQQTDEKSMFFRILKQQNIQTAAPQGNAQRSSFYVTNQHEHVAVVFINCKGKTTPKKFQTRNE